MSSGCILFALVLSSFVSHACSACVDPNSVPSTYAVITYQDSDEHVENPHRGFVRQLVTYSGHHDALTKSQLDSLREQSGLTMVWRTFVLDSFVTSPIADDYLNKIRHDLDAVDSASFTAVLRFCYIFEMKSSHPYGDASKNIVLRHISQLQPIFREYERVITTIQAGFIGAWGEWHATEYFGNPQWQTAGHDPVTGLMPQAFADRKAVLVALLNAAPKSIQIQLRYPPQKMHMMGSIPASYQDVQREADNARTGHHNDCFLSSDNDVGTYINKDVEYPYLEQDTRFTIMGGETCSLTNNHRHECPTATKELAMFHWTFLNEAFNQDMYNVWKQQGCYPDVHKRLGYRLTLNKAILPKTVSVGGALCFHLEFRNLGYAVPVKDLKLYIVLKSTASDNGFYAAPIENVDVRNWQPTYSQTVSSAVRVLHVPPGQYKVLLQLRDPLMGQRSDYNVLLATRNVPLHTMGLNDLGHTITVTSGQSSSSESYPALTSWQPPASGHYARVFKGSF